MTSIQQRQKSSSSFEEPWSPRPPSNIEYSEEEEEEEEEEYEEEEEEEEEAKRGKGYDRLTTNITTKQAQQRTIPKISTVEEEEEEEEEEYEDYEDEEEEEENANSAKTQTVEVDWSRPERTAAAKNCGKPGRGEDSWYKAISAGRRAKEEGFDFAKLHLGQHGKDDIMVIQEPTGPGKDGVHMSEGRDIPTPKSKTSVSSVKATLSGRRRERISPSDGDSVVSDGSSGRDSGEEPRRGQATPSDSKQTQRKMPINVLNGPPPVSGVEQLSTTAAIFEHVDRMSRSTEASRRLPNKIQLIAMQPMAVPPILGPAMQVALRHKSEIEHHRNKIRLRAKRKGHYDFPAMESVSTNGFSDAKDPGRIYQKARQQIDRILDPELHMPSIFTEPKKGGRGRRSPRQRRADQLSGAVADADRDHLITSDSD
ncbi:hypothetical protein CRUP_037246, partial [Coryphaenoides rupestris]